jgi:cell division protease FtsH
MISIYGLNDRVGNISYYDSQGRDAFTKPYSEDRAKVIDEEVSKLIESQYQRALQLLNENKAQLEQLAARLLSSEVIFKEDLEAIFGKRQWDPIIDEAVEEVQEEAVEAEVEQVATEDASSEAPSDEATPPAETNSEENAS